MRFRQGENMSDELEKNKVDFLFFVKIVTIILVLLIVIILAMYFWRKDCFWSGELVSTFPGNDHRCCLGLKPVFEGSQDVMVCRPFWKQ